MSPSSGSRRWISLGMVLFIAFAGAALAPGTARAQIDCSLPTPWPDGCTLSSNFPLWAQMGLDQIFLGACSNHDLCYGTCGAAKSSCDLGMLADMEAACAFWAGQVALPFGDLQTAQDFVTYCNGVVAPTIYGLLVAVGQTAFNKDQCVRCCDLNACNSASCIIPSNCYPPPPPPPPPIYYDPCWGVDCGCGCDDYCCGGCFFFDAYCFYSRWEPHAKPRLRAPLTPRRATSAPGELLRSILGATAKLPTQSCATAGAPVRMATPK